MLRTSQVEWSKVSHRFRFDDGSEVLGSCQPAPGYGYTSEDPEDRRLYFSEMQACASHARSQVRPSCSIIEVDGEPLK